MLPLQYGRGVERYDSPHDRTTLEFNRGRDCPLPKENSPCPCEKLHAFRSKTETTTIANGVLTYLPKIFSSFRSRELPRVPRASDKAYMDASEGLWTPRSIIEMNVRSSPLLNASFSCESFRCNRNSRITTPNFLDSAKTPPRSLRLA
jgi:hypothetical protein